MARTLPKERFLPSLLDRLTDDDPVNNSIQLQKLKIKRTEKELVALKSKQQIMDVADYKIQCQTLQQQLDQLHAQFNVYTAAISSLTEIRACVKRDLNWLLNANQYAPPDELQNYPQIKTSVLNYGIPDLTGKTVSGVKLQTMERMLEEVIINFEPRIISKTLTVRVLVDASLFNHNAVTFEIEGQLWAEPQPLHLHLRTEFELESGSVSVYDFGKVSH